MSKNSKYMIIDGIRAEYTDEKNILQVIQKVGIHVPTFCYYSDMSIYGACRMCVAGPESARELLKHHELIRVATKYPNIAKDYFYNRKHQTVEIIKLNGSIELAPIVGLSEVIVDIVETGSTLKENGLQVLEEVCPLSARMVVNQVSMKMEYERINKIIKELKEVLAVQE